MCEAIASFIYLQVPTGQVVAAKVSFPPGAVVFFGFILRSKGLHIGSRNEHQVLPGSSCSHAKLLSPFPEICLLQVRKSFPLLLKVCIQLLQSPVLLGGKAAACSPSAAGGDPGRGYTHILSPLDVMKPVIKENVGLDLGKDGALGSPVHEESLVDGQTPFAECLEGSDAHVPAAAGSHQVGANGGIFLAELLAYLPKVHGKRLQRTLEAQQNTWEWVGYQETSVQDACSSSSVFQSSAEHRNACRVQDWAMPGLVLGTGVFGRKASVVVLILVPK